MSEKQPGLLHEVFNLFVGVVVVLGAAALLGAGIEDLK